jgi:Ca-activated chloride channel homolog
MRLVILLAAVLAGAAQSAQFRTGVDTVAVYVTVTDREGRLVPDLTRDDFRILDNRRPVEITTFSNEIQPITVAVMLDMSGSMLGGFLRVRESTLRFVEALLPWDRATIGSFGSEIAVSPLLTGDKDILRRVAREELWPNGPTPLWNAIDAGMSALEDETGRRVVLVLTDGQDTGGLPGHRAGRRQVSRRARDHGFMIYAIGLEGAGIQVINSRGVRSQSRPSLEWDVRSLAEDTGGGSFSLTVDADLGATFERVAEELRRQYVLGFTPTVLDGREHRLDVQVTVPGDRARARRSYLALMAERR